VAQTFFGTSPAIKEFQRLMGSNERRDDGTPAPARFLHGGNPVARWMASVVEAKDDGQDNLRLVKPERLKSQARIDGMAAMVTGLDGYLRRPRPKQRRKVVVHR
jgi:phage terminase large subunit-like protein